MADTAKNKSEVNEITDIADGLRALAEHARELEQRLRAQTGGTSSRGTREIPVFSSPRPARQPIDLDLYHRVRKMLETEPMRLQHIIEATGLDANKVKVLITKMQREGVHIINIGAANKALWYIPDRKALARLEQLSPDED